MFGNGRNNFGTGGGGNSGFNRGEFGGGMRFPFGGSAQQGGFQQQQFRPKLPPQQRPGIPGLQSNYRTLLHRPNQPPVQQIQQAARPMVPPATRGAGGSFGAGAAIQGDVNGAGRLARPLMDNPAAFGGFLSVPPEPTRPTTPPSLPGRPQMNNVYGVDGPGPGDNSPIGDDVRQRVYGGGQTGQGLTPQQIQQRTNMGGPAGGARSSFANTPARQWTPLEQATMTRFEADQAMNQLQDANPNYRDNLAGSMERDRGIMEKGMVPDVNDPNFRGITPQQAFQQIPGNPFNVMRDRFNAIEANRTPVEPPMTASQPTSTMPNYQQRLAQADPRVSGIVNDGYAMSDPDNRITPMPRVSTINGVPQPSRLSETERARIGAVGGSAREWEEKSKWMAERGYTQYTPEVAQAHTAEQQQKRLQRNDDIHAQKMARIGQAEQIRGAKTRQSSELMKRYNPELYTAPDFVAAQLASSLAGGNITNFQYPGPTPYQALQASLYSQQQAIEEAQFWQGQGNPERAAQAMERARNPQGAGYGGVGGGQYDPASADRFNRDEDGKLSNGRMAGKMEQILRNPNATADDLIQQGINSFTVAELEQGLNSGWFSDPADVAAMKDLIRRAKQVLGQRPTQPPTGQPPVRQRPTAPPSSSNGLGAEPFIPFG